MTAHLLLHLLYIIADPGRSLLIFQRGGFTQPYPESRKLPSLFQSAHRFLRESPVAQMPRLLFSRPPSGIFLELICLTRLGGFPPHFVQTIRAYGYLINCSHPVDIKNPVNLFSITELTFHISHPLYYNNAGHSPTCQQFHFKI